MGRPAKITCPWCGTKTPLRVNWVQWPGKQANADVWGEPHRCQDGRLTDAREEERA